MSISYDPHVASAKSFKNRESLDKSSLCGCFFCLSVFDPKRISSWVDGGNTALCPYCGIDSVLPEEVLVSYVRLGLKELSTYWFAGLGLEPCRKEEKWE